MVLAAAVALILVTVTTRAGTSGAMNAASLSSPGCGSAFGGYPGQRGAVTVSSIASAGGTRLAVGSAAGRPAIWRCAGGGWQPVPAAAPSGDGTLTSVAHGPAGWIAVGDTASGGVQHPFAVTSAAGNSWRPAASPAASAGQGSCVTAIASGPSGYAVVGDHIAGSRISAAMWSSPDPRRWAQDNSDRGGVLDGRRLKSVVDAVAAVPDGLVAVGIHGPGGAIWTSADGGQQWTLTDYTSSGVPSGALTLVAATGSRVVAAGYAVTQDGGEVPVVVASTDGGLHWNPPVVLGTGGSQGGRVTALSVTGSGFAAAGQVGPAGAQRTVTWRSPDGQTWSKATPAASGTSAVIALSARGETVTSAPQPCRA